MRNDESAGSARRSSEVVKIMKSNHRQTRDGTVDAGPQSDVKAWLDRRIGEANRQIVEADSGPGQKKVSMT